MDPQGFINSDGFPTEDGYKLIAWMEAQFTEADKSNDVALINSMSGDVQHYYVNVAKLKTLTPEAWLRDYRNSIARSAYRNYVYTQEMAQREAQEQSQLESTTRKAAELEAGMNSLQEALAAQKSAYEQEMAALREELDRLMYKGKKRAKAVATDTDEDDAETEV